MEEKWGFITGCTGGIGEKIMLKFLSCGYHVYAHARRQTEEFEQKLASMAEAYSAQIIPVYFDLTDSEAMKTEMQRMIKEKRRVDVLVNNAGVIHSGLFQMTEMQTVRGVFDVNLFAVMELTQWVLKLMIRKKRGSIVNISSMGGIHPGMGMCAYGVSKAALIAFTETLAAEAGNYGIRVNAVAPGFVNTRMGNSDEVKMEREALEGRRGPFARMAEPEEIANVVYFLGSEEASYVNGQVLRIDGGNR